MDRPLRVLFYVGDNTGSAWYRQVQPALKLEQHKLAEAGIFQVGIDSPDQLPKAIDASDVLVFSRSISPRLADQLHDIKKVGIKVVIDINDDWFHVDPFSPHYQHLGLEEYASHTPEGVIFKIWEDGRICPNGEKFDIKKNREQIEFYKALWKEADLITCTTPYLAEIYGQFAPTVVLPNMVDLQIWKNVHTHYLQENYRRLGWRGGPSHFQDIMTLRHVAWRLLNKWQNLKLVLSGHHFKSFTQDFPGERVELHGWMGNVAYPWHMMALGIDVAFYPWLDTEFNKGKNNLAWVEWSAVGVPGVYPALKPYMDHVKHGETGLLALSEEGWFESINKLIKDQFYRRRIAQNARAEVEKNWDINKRIGEWATAYRNISERGSIVCFTKLPDHGEASANSATA